MGTNITYFDSFHNQRLGLGWYPTLQEAKAEVERLRPLMREPMEHHPGVELQDVEYEDVPNG